MHYLLFVRLGEMSIVMVVGAFLLVSSIDHINVYHALCLSQSPLYIVWK